MFTSILQDISVKLVHNAKLISTCVEDSGYNRLLYNCLISCCCFCAQFFFINTFIIQQEGTAKWAQSESTSPTKKLANLKKRRSKFMEMVRTFCTLHSIHIRFVLAMQEKRKSCARGVGWGLLSFSATPLSLPPPIFLARPCVAPALFLLGLKETEMTAKLVNVFVMLEITIKSATF